MSTARKLALVDVKDYLAGELRSPVKHEYVNGAVHAMAGASNQHNRIVGNIYAFLFGQLRRKPCQPYNSDTKVRIRTLNQTRFYYPDVSVVCQANAPGETFQDQPVVIFEVLSPSTRRVDLGEKKDSYLSIPSLLAYVLVDQDSPMAIVYRKSSDGWARQVYDGLEGVIRLNEIDAELSLVEIYDGVEFVPEPPEQEPG